MLREEELVVSSMTSKIRISTTFDNPRLFIQYVNYDTSVAWDHTLFPSSHTVYDVVRYPLWIMFRDFVVSECPGDFDDAIWKKYVP